MTRLRSTLLTAILLTAVMLWDRSAVLAQSPSPVTSCGTYSGNLILTQNISSAGDCITIGAANTTLNGNGHSISAGSHAVYNYNKANLTVQNLTANSDVYINGESAGGARVENSTLSSVAVIAADDVVITNNTLGHAYLGQEDSDTQRLTFTNNHVEGVANKLVEMRGSGVPPCAASNDVFSGNTLIANHTCSGAGCDEPMTMFIWCIRSSTFSNNTIRATGQSQGIRLRDASDNNTFSNNTVWVSNAVNGDFGALNITSGNVDKNHPENNTFTDNLFRSDGDFALDLQSPGSGNTFLRNVFWANTGGTANMSNDGANDNRFQYNTFYNAGSSPALTFDYWNNRPADLFRNNLFATAGATALQINQFAFNRYAGGRNLFWGTNASVLTSAYGSLSGWRTASGNTDDMNSAYGNPLFVNAAGGDFHLPSSSPARGLGDSGADAGAFQYDGSAPTPCAESWSCGAWSSCVNSTQSRTCTDSNACGPTVNRPALSQACSTKDTIAPARVSNLLAL